MRTGRIAFAVAVMAAQVTFGPAMAQQNQTTPPKRVVPDDRPINRPPPRPPDRPYVAPTPGPSQPMQRIAPVPPLAQPPTR